MEKPAGATTKKLEVSFIKPIDIEICRPKFKMYKYKLQLTITEFISTTDTQANRG